MRGKTMEVFFESYHFFFKANSTSKKAFLRMRFCGEKTSHMHSCAKFSIFLSRIKWPVNLKSHDFFFSKKVVFGKTLKDSFQGALGTIKRKNYSAISSCAISRFL